MIFIMNRQAFSVVIITYNERVHIKECIESVRFADDILVVDSGSTDGTLDILDELGIRWMHKEWGGYGLQKHYAAMQAEYDWVLSIDADERITPKLRESILEFLGNPPTRAARLLRRNRFLGHWLRWGEGFPDYTVRLFNRRYCNWQEDIVHESVETGTEPLITLGGEMLHYSEDDIHEYASKQVRYAHLRANMLYEERRRSSVLQVMISPFLRFIRFYVIRLGILDGFPGFSHIALGCFSSFLKHLENYERWKTKS